MIILHYARQDGARRESPILSQRLRNFAQESDLVRWLASWSVDDTWANRRKLFWSGIPNKMEVYSITNWCQQYMTRHVGSWTCRLVSKEHAQIISIVALTTEQCSSNEWANSSLLLRTPENLIVLKIYKISTSRGEILYVSCLISIWKCM